MPDEDENVSRWAAFGQSASRPRGTVWGQLDMADDVTITLSHDEALVLFEFFSRFQVDGDEFVMRNNAEYLALMCISAQLDKALVEMFQPDYQEILQAARERIAAGYEGLAPGVRPDNSD